MSIQSISDYRFSPQLFGNGNTATFALSSAHVSKKADAKADADILPGAQPLFPVDLSGDDENQPNFAPGAIVFGVTQGPVLNQIAQNLSADMLPPGAAAFGIVPIGGSITEDLSGFFAQPVMQHKMNLGPLGDLRVGIGAVATIRPDSSLADSPIEGGIGVTFSPPPITTPSGQTIPILGFLNFRQEAGEAGSETELTLEELADGDEVRLPPGLYSVNFGVAFSVLGATAAALESLGQLLAMIPKPAAAAVGQSMLKLQQALNGVQNFADLKAGLGWRLIAEVDEAGEVIFKLGGQVVDPMQIVEDALSASALPELPILDNPNGDPAVARVNDTIALINGGDPFELARQRSGQCDVPALRLAREAIDVVRVSGSVLYPFLSDWAKNLSAHGPESIDDVTRFLQEIWQNPATPQQVRDDIAGRLANPYSINFGRSEIELLNEMMAPAQDFEFIRYSFGIE
ncbi:MAG: hypothetical protein JJU21_14625 [Salinarimonas sp.]|nr:hypothetical protein [Salinarimonas sp.]